MKTMQKITEWIRLTNTTVILDSSCYCYSLLDLQSKVSKTSTLILDFSAFAFDCILEIDSMLQQRKYLRHELNVWNVHRIMNTSGLL